ncbi:MAG: hypothetical protein R6V44_17540 [Paracoccaceae bacterium]
MPSTPQAFFERLRAAHDAADAETYVDCFELPSVAYVEAGPQILREEEDLHARLAALAPALRDLGVEGHAVEFRSIRPYAAHLVTVRAAIRFHLEGGLETDEREEFWVLRERGGVLRLCCTVNSTAGNLLDRPEAEIPSDAADGARGVESGRPLLDEMQATFNRRDARAHAALLDTTFVRIGDMRSDVTERREGRIALSKRFFAAVDRAGIAGMRMTALAERPYGRDYALMRVEVVVVHQDGRRADPFEELWVMRQVDGHLRLAAIVNPFAPRFLSDDRPLRRPS